SKYLHFSTSPGKISAVPRGTRNCIAPATSLQIKNLPPLTLLSGTRDWLTKQSPVVPPYWKRDSASEGASRSGPGIVRQTSGSTLPAGISLRNLQVSFPASLQRNASSLRRSLSDCPVDGYSSCHRRSGISIVGIRFYRINRGLSRGYRPICPPVADKGGKTGRHASRRRTNPRPFPRQSRIIGFSARSRRG